MPDFLRPSLQSFAAYSGRIVPVLIGWMAVTVGLNGRAAPAAANVTLDQYCIDCHDAGARKGDLVLEGLDVSTPAANAEVWERVIRKLVHRQMPPVGEARPDEPHYDATIAQLRSAIDLAAAAKPNPGRTETFRRLTRTEYRNAIRDLLSLDVDVSTLLPKDDSSHGFDNITVGELSPMLLERYLAAAKKIAQLAVGRAPPSPIGETAQVPIALTQEGEFNELPLGTRGGAAARFYFPVDGEYEVQLRLARDRNDRVEGLRRGHDLELLIDGEPISRFQIKPPPERTMHHQVDRHLVLRQPFKAGSHEVSATFLRTSTTLIESERAPTLARYNMDRHPRLQPALYSITVIGPYNAAGPGDTPARRRLFPSYPSAADQEDRCAKEAIAVLMRRAFRRPVTPEDMAGPLRFYQETKAAEGFEAGMETAVRAILVSPQFLFRIEQEPAGVAAGAVYRVPDLQLASRLSFFLWSSLPDDELLAAAEKGELSKPGTLEAHTRRMLRDPRSQALVDSFAAQWLHLRNLELARPDARLFLDFDENLRDALRQETELFFQSMLREDRSALDLLRADYTYLNERLAKHYGIPHVYGSNFRRVKLPADSPRGGLLTQGSILTVTSHPNRTSPVVRGNWILANLLGTPPKPPPPDVPQLKEKDAAGAVLPIREQMAAHRNQKACASCHNLMDPIGFALENYDAVGRWRTAENNHPVDASGALADGAQFRGARELQAALLKRPELFITTLTEKLLIYSLGRGLAYYDAPAVRRIVEHAAYDDYRFSALVIGIVQSTPFQMRTSK